MQQELVVGYWNCRGRVGVLTQLLDYCGVSFKLKRYDAPDQWFGKEKESLEADFPNLPYIIDGDKKITESLALIEYAVIRGNRKDLLGKTEEDQTKVNVALSVAKDLFEGQKDENFLEGAGKEKLGYFNKVLEGKEWVCGYLTAVDFLLFEDLDLIYEVDKTKLDPYPNLVGLRERFLKMPEVQAHRASDHYFANWLPSWVNLPNRKQKQNEKVILGYWNLRGIGHTARYLLEYLKIPYEDKRYNTYEEWIAEKETLGLDFPNLPYLIHGEKKITESLAVYDYIALIANRKDMLGSTDEERIQHTTISGVLADIKAEFIKLVFGTPKEEFEKAREVSWTNGVSYNKLIRLEKFLGDKAYLFGKISVLDFVLFNYLDIVHDMKPSKLEEFPKLSGLYNRIAEIPEIKALRTSDRHCKAFFPSIANWTQAQ